MAKHITTAELKQNLDAGEELHLIDTLAANSFETWHIPGAKSVPYSTDFVAQFEQAVGAPKDAEIVTYCASNGCQLSSLAADALEEAGYANVGHYADGLAGWKSAGYPLEGEAA